MAIPDLEDGAGARLGEPGRVQAGDADAADGHAADVEIFDESGAARPAWSNLVYGGGREVGDTIVRHPAIQAVSFTGSNDVGTGLYSAAAARGIKCQCEMGGKNPIVILEDADLDLAVESTVQGAFGSTGQRCTATSRAVVVDRSPTSSSSGSRRAPRRSSSATA